MPAPPLPANTHLPISRWPFLIHLVIIMMLLPCLLPTASMLGFRLSGWAWVSAGALSAYVIASEGGRIRFPILLWLPWLVILGVNLIFRPWPGALQYTVQFACPIAVGLAASTLRPTDFAVSEFFLLMRKVSVVLLAVVIVRYPILLSFRLPAYSDLAPQAMTAILLASLFVVSHAYGRRSDIQYYAAAAVVPIAGLTRTAIAVMLSLLVVSFAPIRLRRRLLFTIISVAVALLLFHTERVQSMMFRSGEGTLSELRWGNPNLETSGREAMWKLVQGNIKHEPIWGHGSKSCAALLTRNGYTITQPHNDWLRITHDYGLVGTAAFTFGIFAQILSLLLVARRMQGVGRVLCHAGATAFLPFMMMMITDNIATYVGYFGNLHFLMIGLAYGNAELAKTTTPAMPETAPASDAPPIPALAPEPSI